LGGVRGDATSKAIQADIDALKAGYASADEMARKLEQSHNKAIRAAEAADRKRETEARKAAQAAEEQLLMEGRRADHML
ncbi:hypothetical protein ACTUQ0_15340, partial [Listeria monocytogenes]|uniref:hypothetical protein n=1 Tax=Listeria monocytogenes TaxID=1639 RepID=UPI003FA47B0B